MGDDRMCKLFGHKPDCSDIADFVCLRCGEHIKVEWSRPPRGEDDERD